METWQPSSIRAFLGVAEIESGLHEFQVAPSSNTGKWRVLTASVELTDDDIMNNERMQEWFGEAFYSPVPGIMPSQPEVSAEVAQ
eukprot:1325190-Amphidinium_carterae.1